MFSYKKVTTIKTRTAIAIDQWNINKTSNEEVRLLDGIPVTARTKNFAERLRKVLWGCTFGVDKDCKTVWVNGSVVYADVWLMIPGQAYALARVGYANYSPSGKGDAMYMIYSRTVENEKYRANTDQYYMMMSTDIERALKNAKKHIRMYTPMDYAQMTARDFTDEIADSTDAVQDKWRGARNKIRESDFLYKELKHLVESGHRFLSDEFTQMMTAWIDTAKAWDAEKNRPVPAYFVHVSVVRDVQVFEVVEIDDAKKPLGAYAQMWAEAKSQKFKADDMPEDIMGKLSVLSLLEPGQYSQGVGKRIDEAMFWVERT